MTTFATADHLPDEFRASADDLVQAATATDGHCPLNEMGRLAVRGDAAGTFWWLEADRLTPDPQAEPHHPLAALAWRDARDGGVQLVVHPDHRRRGLGRGLVETTLADEASTHWWAFGTTPGALAIAMSQHLDLTRQLLVMERDLTRHPLPQSSAASPTPQGVTITGFTPADIDALVAVNAAAFAHHPEQGRLSAADVRLRMAEPWFDAEGLLLARDTAGTLLGFHWTKIDPDHPHTGEVYVLGVHPDHAGRGLGRVLLERGLQHLARRGCTTVELYVEASESRVVRLYESANFVVRSRDSSFGRGLPLQKD